MRFGLIVLATLAALLPASAQVEAQTSAVRKTTAQPAKPAAKPTTAVQPAPSADEKAIFDAANEERSSRGLPQFRWNAALAKAARGHALKMAQEGSLSHQFPGEANMGLRIRMTGLHFGSAAENVAEAPTSTALHQEWMNSPPHRSNILDPELDSLGVAVVKRNGQLFAVQDFAMLGQ